MAKWEFVEMLPGEVNVDPVQGNFFTDQDICDRLIRESVQNSLDEKFDAQHPVHMKITLNETTQLKNSVTQKYMNGFEQHLESSLKSAIKSGHYVDVPSVLNLLGSEMKYLMIEDFNTTGLNGNINQWDDSENETAEGNNFYWFIRNIGRTGKTGSKMGSWGLGKWVFSDASKINVVFLYSLRESNPSANDGGEEIMMGTTTLFKHTIDSGENKKKYPPYGFYCNLNSEGLQIPLNSQTQNDLSQFKHDFGITRNPGEKGLSIVMPFPHDGVNYHELIKSAIQYYFYPIIRNELTLSVSDGQETTVLNSDTIFDVTDKIFNDENNDYDNHNSSPREMKKMYSLAGTVADSVENIITVNTHNLSRKNRPNDWDEMFSKSELERLRKRFTDGETLVFKIPVWVHKKHKPNENNDPVESYFMLGIQTDPELEESHQRFVREFLAIPDVAKNNSSGIPVRSFTIVNDAGLEQILRDSEPPSHNDWIANEERIKENYDLPQATVRFVKNALGNLLRLLTYSPQGIDKEALMDVFSIPKKMASTGGPGPIPGRQRRLTVSKLTNGINVISNKTFDENEYIDLEIAYDAVRSPFRNHSEYEFDLGKYPIQIKIDGGKLQKTTANTARIVGVENPFSLSITGFDSNRDIITNIKIGQDNSSL